MRKSVFLSAVYACLRIQVDWTNQNIIKKDPYYCCNQEIGSSKGQVKKQIEVIRFSTDSNITISTKDVSPICQKLYEKTNDYTYSIAQ